MTINNTSADTNDLQQVLHYTFKDPELLKEALRHSSFVNEHHAGGQLRDNERLEFLGDAVLNLVIGHLLMRAYPTLREGELSRVRANMVNELQLAEIARGLNLGGYLMLGRGEIQTGGQDKNSLLANALEALIAAVYLDGGFAHAFKMVEHHFGSLVQSAPSSSCSQDFKSRLQEAVQSSTREIPRYTLLEQTGPDHDKTFRVKVNVIDIETEGIGKSKKTAEQDAARRALNLLDG